MASEIIRCIIKEQPIRCTLQEDSPIAVTIERGGLSERVWELLNLYLIQEDLTSQVVEGKTDFSTTQQFLSVSLKVFVNGLKEKKDKVTILTDNSFRLSPAIDSGDIVEVEFVKKVE